jgi:hypothetical protein
MEERLTGTPGWVWYGHPAYGAANVPVADEILL